jgi:UDP-GlcNAc:undecaprenyl-phosphate GlcNAc-1-phosphate transferase
MPALVSFLVAVALQMFFVWLAGKKKVADTRTSARHIHPAGISRFGGVALILAFIAAVLLDKRLVMTAPLLAVLVASGAILFFGVLDDIRQLSWKTQLFFQVVVVFFVYFAGVRLQYMTNPFGGIFLFNNQIGYVLGLIVVVLWVVFIMNAINWIDGIDGSSAGVAFIGALAIFFLSLRPEVNQPPVGIIAAALLGALAAFLLFNFHPARILAGTSGSMFMGFILAIMAIFAGAKIATTLLVLAIPIIDALWVIGERIWSNSSIFSADRRHLHYRLLELGWSEKKICLFYYGVTALIAVAALNTRVLGKTVILVVIGILMVAFLFLIRNRISQKTL